ncbi:hypothetical protein G7Y89_g13940 [Cudoniella acicularis]|uniref:Uncharacterized protein n=1 Tax=Cudoniella acicularis TaxID=354080 RepID=A0A8H4R9P0_9HELO|nr:hypothetical protein G7Y89_g13940 [Cudoniella acicularis]
MRFTSLFTAAGLLASVAIAEPIAPRQTAAFGAIQNSTSLTPQESTALSQLASFISALPTQPGWSSLSALVATNTAIANAVSSWESSVNALTGNNPITAISLLPTEVQPFFSSVYNAENSIITADGLSGFIPQPTSTSTSKAGAASTPFPLGAAGAAAAGFVGLVMAL